MSEIEHFDVIVVGAGISGIDAAVHLQRQCPTRSMAIVEARANIGGTWDLFRYPGIRSDSDMYTLGYSFKPWKQAKAIADGPSILEYLDEAVREEGILDKIRFGHRVTAAAWDSNSARWLVTMRHAGNEVRLSCNFLHMCSGYFDYEKVSLPSSPAGSASPAASCIRSTGRRTSTTAASASPSSAAAPRR